MNRHTLAAWGRVLVVLLGFFGVLAAVGHLGSASWALFVAAGTWMLVLGGMRLHQARTVRSWPTVHARVINVEVKETRAVTPGGSEHVYFYPELSLLVPLKGTQVETQGYGVVRGDFRTSTRTGAERLLAEHSVGDLQKVFVSPANARWVVVSPVLSRRLRVHCWLWLVGGTLTVVVGALVGGYHYLKHGGVVIGPT